MDESDELDEGDATLRRFRLRGMRRESDEKTDEIGEEDDDESDEELRGGLRVGGALGDDEEDDSDASSYASLETALYCSSRSTALIRLVFLSQVLISFSLVNKRLFCDPWRRCIFDIPEDDATKFRA